MSHDKDRADFIEAMAAEGMPYDVATAILRDAQTIQTCAVRECSDESAEHDRVRCPDESWKAVDGKMQCLCRDYGANDGVNHGTLPRIAVRSYRAERRIEQRLRDAKLFFFSAVFSGDPRGNCVKLRVPSGRNDSWGGEGVMCVPAKG